MFKTACLIVLLAVACRPAKTCPAPAAPAPASADDPQTSMERRVMLFNWYVIQDERDALIDQDRDRYFMALTREALDPNALDRPRRVRGSACRWIISYAQNLRDSLEIGQPQGVWYAPDYLEPGQMATLKKLAALDARAVCPRPAVAAP